MANSRLQWKTQEITDLESEIRKIEEERDHLERSIRNVTTEPFMRKEGQSLLARLADVELKVKEKIAYIKQLGIEKIFIGNGSDEAIDLLYRCFCEPGIDEVIVFPPTYGMYEVSANINDVEIT